MPQRLTINGNHYLHEGDLIEVLLVENRWWVKLWYTLTFRSTPKRVKQFKIEATTSMTLILKDREW